MPTNRETFASNNGTASSARTARIVRPSRRTAREARRARTAARRFDSVRGRSVVLIDLENVIGDPWATGPAVVEAYEAVLEAAGHVPGDLVVVAANRWLCAELGTRPHTPAQILTASGPDGADLALIGWVREWDALGRCGRVVVASGDHAFAGVAAEAERRGMAVLVVRGRGAVAGVLRHLPIAGVRIG